MAKTKIEWTDWTCNCFWGCQNTCSYCQARSIARRFGVSIGSKRGYDPITIGRMASFMPVFLADQIAKIPKKPCRVFMSFMGDPFGDWNKPEWLHQAFDAVKSRPNHTFLMLTKQPQNLAKWSPFPDNCWVGVSATNFKQFAWGMDGLMSVKASVKFISFEPLLSAIASSAPYPGYNIARFGVHDLKSVGISWVIIGQQTPVKASTTPKIKWVREIVEAADKAAIPVFLKDNLAPLLKRPEGWTDALFVSARSTDGKEYLRQEYPVRS